MSKAIYKFNPIKDDFEKKLESYKKENNVDKILSLARRYLDGDDINYHKAITCYKTALELGSSKAVFGLAEAYYKLAIVFPFGTHEELSNSIKEAIYYYKEAAKNLDERAIEKIAKIYDEGIVVNTVCLPSSKLELVKPDKKEAFKWYKILAECDNVTGIRMLGYMYFNGIGTEEDKVEAFRQYKILSQKGDQKALEMVALMYKLGIGIEKNIPISKCIHKSIEIKNDKMPK